MIIQQTSAGAAPWITAEGTSDAVAEEAAAALMGDEMVAGMVEEEASAAPVTTRMGTLERSDGGSGCHGRGRRCFCLGRRQEWQVLRLEDFNVPVKRGPGSLPRRRTERHGPAPRQVAFLRPEVKDVMADIERLPIAAGADPIGELLGDRLIVGSEAEPLLVSDDLDGPPGAVREAILVHPHASRALRRRITLAPAKISMAESCKQETIRNKEGKNRLGSPRSSSRERVVRLQSIHNKYLEAETDERRVGQHQDRSSGGARWTVEVVTDILHQPCLSVSRAAAAASSLRPLGTAPSSTFPGWTAKPSDASVAEENGMRSWVVAGSSLSTLTSGPDPLTN
ncbi:hypothetical protein MUK42_34218 [Musa troglodytarum]|uniref:DUF569 domain-containing protein n=1 Tax=Musa troglodytarum TaxID=320322 RepID=A0A9E7G3J5_9LILI|nr:hypothetical protein MUK42_34218 [Musa troglodytarum]